MPQINIYVRPQPQYSVVGRVDYLTNKNRQENLIATYETSGVDDSFWQDLSKHCQQQASEAGHDRGCEGREWHGFLPNELADVYKDEPEKLAQKISKIFSELTGTDNLVALHWNHAKNNFHYHCLCSENKQINQTITGAVLTRNTYFDAAGKRSTKKACTDEQGNLLRGCTFYRKGEQVKKFQRFGSKEDLKDPVLNEKIKNEMIHFLNMELQEERFKLFVKDGMHIATQHVGNKVKGEKKTEIENKNEAVREWNRAIDEHLSFIEANYDEETLNEEKDLIRKSRSKISMMADKGFGSWLDIIREQTENIRQWFVYLDGRIGQWLDKNPAPIKLWQQIRITQEKIDNFWFVHTSRWNNEANDQKKKEVQAERKKAILEKEQAVSRFMDQYGSPYLAAAMEVRNENEEMLTYEQAEELIRWESFRDYVDNGYDPAELRIDTDQLEEAIENGYELDDDMTMSL